MGSDPAVSVVMPVRNGVPYVDDAIASILNQDFRELELVILDEASTDNTFERLTFWARRDPRVRVIRNMDEPLGLVGSSNAVVREARADVIARLDADDVSRSDRLTRQLRVLTEDPSVSVVGCLARGIDAHGRVIRPRDLARLLPSYGAPPSPHSSWMFRRASFEEVGGYAEGTAGWEDKAFIHEMAKVGRVVTLAAPLVDVRYHGGGATVTTDQDHRERLLSQERLHIQGSIQEGTIGPDSYRLRAAIRVWSGNRPDVAPRFPSRRSTRWLTRSLPICLYATWGRVSPRTLRFALGSGLRIRNILLGPRFQKGTCVEWRRLS